MRGGCASRRALALCCALALGAGACHGSSNRTEPTTTRPTRSATTTVTDTPSEAGFLAFGDAGSADAAQQQVADAMTAWVASGHRADALVEAGDDVYPAGEPSRFAAALDEPYAELRRTRPLWVALGNHDVQAGHGNEQLRHLGLPDLPYAESLPDVQLLFLDANHPDEAQARWLDEHLSQPGPRFRVVVFHQPAYSCGPHGSTPAVDQWWVPVLEQHRVALVLNGHDHYYERFRSTNDVTYVVTGGAGAELYARRPSCRGTPPSQANYEGHEFVGVEVTGTALTLRAVDADGNVFDQAVITR